MDEIVSKEGELPEEKEIEHGGREKDDDRDRPLGEDGEGRRHAEEVEMQVPALQGPKIETVERHHHEQRESDVGQDRLGHRQINRGCGEEDPGKPRDLWIEHATTKKERRNNSEESA